MNSNREEIKGGEIWKKQLNCFRGIKFLFL